MGCHLGQALIPNDKTKLSLGSQQNVDEEITKKICISVTDNPNSLKTNGDNKQVRTCNME